MSSCTQSAPPTKKEVVSLPSSKPPAATRMRDAFEVMMTSSRKRIKLNPLQEQEPMPEESPVAPTQRNAFEQIMLSAQKPNAFGQESERASDQDVLGYLKRHPEWRFLMAELIRKEKEQEKEKGDGKEEAEPTFEEKDDKLRKICHYFESKTPTPPTDGDINDNQIWQVEQLRKELSEGTVQLKNDLLTGPPRVPNKGSALTEIHVHFEESRDSFLNEEIQDVCGLTCVFDDHVEIPSGSTTTSSRCKVTVKLMLQTGEHISKIGTHRSRWQKNFFGVLTTNNRWLIAKNGKRLKGKRWAGSAFVYPVVPGKGTFQCLKFSRQKDWDAYGNELEDEDGDISYIPTVWTGDPRGLSAIDLGHQSTATQGIIPSLQSLCETALQNHLKSRALEASYEAHGEMEEYSFAGDDDWQERVNRFRTQLRKSPEAAVFRSMSLLHRFASGRLDAKCNTLLARAKREQLAAIEATEREKDPYKISCQKEQAEIYSEHLTFRETKALLSAQDDTEKEGEAGSRERLCIFPNCRSLYRPKDLPYSRRCMAQDCGTAFEMCGCMSKVCQKCFESYCPWHIQDHECAPDKASNNVLSSRFNFW